MHDEASGQPEPAGRKHVLVCFHPNDRDGKDALVAYLGQVHPPLTLWSVDEVAAGGSVRSEFLRVAATVDAALVLLSPDFCQALAAPKSAAPDELSLAEQRRLLWRQESRRRLIPVLLCPCDRTAIPWLFALMPTPPGSPSSAGLQSLDAAGRDRVLAELAQYLGALDTAAAPSADEQIAARALKAAAEAAAAAAAARPVQSSVGVLLGALFVFAMLGLAFVAVQSSNPVDPNQQHDLVSYTQLFLNDVPPESAQNQVLFGRLLHDQAQTAPAAERARLTGESVQAYRRALRVVTRLGQPQEWAELQDSLGRALYDQQAELPRGAAREQLLRESAHAYLEALAVYTHNERPQQWAATQHHLGRAFAEQSENVTEAEITPLRNAAVQAYRQALTVYTLLEQPQDFAAVQDNLSEVLGQQSQNATGDAAARLLREEAQAYREALRVYTREQQPLDWARMHNNLCVALTSTPAAASDAESQLLAQEALQSCRQALQVHTRKDDPQSWADTQNNLGSALLRASQSAPEAQRPRLGAAAVQAYRQALQEYSFADQPTDWARTQDGLGRALHRVGQLAPAAQGLRLFGEAAQAYRQSLKVYTQAAFPAEWAEAQCDLGVELHEQSQRSSGAQRPRLLDEAVQAYREAGEVQTPEQAPASWLRSQSNLVLALTQKAKAASGAVRQQLLAEAVQLARRAAQKFPDDQETARDLFILYQEQLFDFASGHTVLADWLRRHPEDFANQANFAESVLTTGRFAETAERLAALLRNPAQTKFHLALRTLEVVVLTALGDPRYATQLRALRELVARQPAQLERGWTYTAVKVFLARDDRLTASRAWLLKLIAAMEKPERAACLQALDAVIAEQPKMAAGLRPAAP